jgi:hypothetical protein
MVTAWWVGRDHKTGFWFNFVTFSCVLRIQFTLLSSGFYLIHFSATLQYWVFDFNYFSPCFFPLFRKHICLGECKVVMLMLFS